VLRALGLGDLLTAVPALRALRDAHPQAELALACPTWLHDLVTHWQLADVTIAADPLRPLPSARAGDGLAVNLHGRGPESTRLLLSLRPRRLLAFRHRELPQTRGLPQWRPREHEPARWCRLLEECGIPAAPGRLDLLPPPPLRSYAGVTLLHPGAASPARRWPAGRWAIVARSELEQGRRVVVTGGRSERRLGLAVARDAGIPADDVVSGETSLLELAALVGSAGLVLSGDTGVAHVATALGTPSVVLFGPVPPSEWGPPAVRRSHRTLWAGGRGDPHAPAADEGLLRIGPRQVLAEIRDLRAELAA
jgi:ADP-heptose:LPS heptosyltransferase